MCICNYVQKFRKHRFKINTSVKVSGASLVVQMVNGLLALQETQVRSLVRTIPWRREWLLTPVFLPREFLGQRSLAGDSPWGCRIGHD